MKLQPKQIFRRWFTGDVNISNESFRRWHVVLAAVASIQAVAVVLFGAPHNVAFMAQYLTKDTLQSQLLHHTVLAPGIRQLFTLNIAYILAGCLLVLAAAHTLFATVCRTQYEASLKQRTMRFRWILYGLTFAAVMTSSALVAGVYDIEALAAVVAFCLIAALSASVLETLGSLPAKHQSRLYAGVLVTAAGAVAMPFVLIIWFVLVTGMFGDSSAVWYVYVTLATAAVWSAAVAGNAYLIQQKRGKWVNYAYGERWYMVLAIVLQSLVVWEVFLAVLKP